MSIKTALPAIGLLLLFNYSIAQETSLHTDPDADYKKGVELFQEEKFGAAQEAFRKSISKMVHEDRNDDHLLLINAYYYDALCSKKLSRPDAEKLFTDLTGNYEESPTTRLAYFHLGDIYFDQKKYDKALTWYKKVDEFDLNTDEKTEYQFQFGFCYFYKKDFEKARTLFDNVKNIQGIYYYPANYYSGYIAYQQGDYTEALRSFKIAEKSELYKSLVPYYLANINFQQKKYDEVISYAASYNSGDKHQYTLEMQQLIGKSYFEKGQFEKALPYFTAYMSGTPKLNKSDIYQIGYCQYQAKKYDEAINSFKELNVLKDSLGQNALYLLADCYLVTNQKNDARLAFEEAAKMDFDPFVKEHATFQFAKLSYELKYHDVSVKALQAFIAAYPESTEVEEARQYLMLEFLTTQNFADALEVLRKMPLKNAQVRQAYQKVAYSRATELYNAKDYDAAIELFDESLKNPADPGLQASCYFWKGESYFHQEKYDEAIKNHNQFLSLLKLKPRLPGNVSEVNSDYTLGYAYLKKEDYDKASDYFDQVAKSFAASSDAEARKLYADATLRNADCHFVLRNYGSAITRYDIIITKKLPGGDYALYQKAIIQGLQNNSSDKVTTLKQITQQYPSSIYMDDALYELGISYLTKASYQDAASVFDQIISKYPNSSYVRKSHLKMGLIYFNLDNDAKALEEYKWVLNKYPKTPEGEEALSGVKEIYTEKGDAQGYLDFVKGVANINVTDASKDSVMYLAAETKYSKNDCAGAIKEFTSYLKAFPSGTFATYAHFYRGECLFRQNDFDGSLADYEFVADEPQNRFTEKSLLQAARINYVQKKAYEKAYKYYSELSAAADLKANEIESYKGMMYSAYYLNRYNEAATAAQKLVSSDKAKSEDQSEAHYYLAKMAFEQGDLSKAFAEFSIPAKEKSAIGAESAYMMAAIYFKQSNFKAAEEQCNNVIKQKSSYDYWIAKSYILIADIYEMQGDYFQAKSTLQSIIDHYKGADDLVSIAKDKLSNVAKKEASGSKLEQEKDDATELDPLQDSN